MMDYSQTLVYVLSITLFIFLVVGIIVMVFLIKILRNVHAVTEHAESLAESFVAVGNAIQKTAVPTAVSGMVANAIGKYVNAKSKSSKNKKED